MKDYNKEPNYIHSCDSKMLDEVYREIFILGYEQAEKDLGWQFAKDSKPNPSEWVVVCIEDHGTPQCLALATYNEELGKWFTDFEDGELEEYHPDYWLRIPNFTEKQ